MKEARMADVAKLAGVSVTTVGRALHGGYITKDKQERIQKAIDTLGYIPNKAASELKGNSPKLFGHLMRFSPNLLYTHIADGIDRCAKSLGYNVFSQTMYKHEDGAVMLDELIGRRVSGIIITSNIWLTPAAVERITRLRIPVVMIERVYDISGVDSVVVNDIGGARKAVGSILNSGKRKVAFVGVYPTSKSVEQERFNGYRMALEDNSIEFNESLVQFTKGYDIEDGYIAAEKIVRGNKADGIFCCSDILAAGVMQYLYEKKIRVPEDISVVGYDDTISNMLAPKISSVALDCDKIGQLAVEMLISKGENPARADRKERIDTVFIDRKS